MRLHWLDVSTGPNTHERHQAESSEAWGSGHRGQQMRYTHYQPSLNPSTHYLSTGAVPVPAPAGMMMQQQQQSAQGHSVGGAPQAAKSTSSSFSVVVDDEYAGTHGRPSGGPRAGAEHEMVPLDDYDHRDGGQAMAYLPIIPKPSSANNSRNNSAGLPTNLAPAASAAVRMDDPAHHHPQHLSSLGRLMNS